MYKSDQEDIVELSVGEISLGGQGMRRCNDQAYRTTLKMKLHDGATPLG